MKIELRGEKALSYQKNHALLTNRMLTALELVEKKDIFHAAVGLKNDFQGLFLIVKDDLNGHAWLLEGFYSEDLSIFNVESIMQFDAVYNREI